MTNKINIGLILLAITLAIDYVYYPKNAHYELSNIKTIDAKMPKNLKGKSKNNLININTADLDMLKSLPAIADTIAKDIIKYREEISKFNTKEDIKKVKRIGDKTYDKIKNLITVD